MHQRCYPRRPLLYGARERKTEAEARADATGVEFAAAPSVAVRASELREAAEVERLAYTRRQAAEALGVSVSTIDRRVVPVIDTVKTPWGQRLIPVAELDRFLWEHLELGSSAYRSSPAGRPPVLPGAVVERVRLEYARGSSLAEIARGLSSRRRPDRPRRPTMVAVHGSCRPAPRFTASTVVLTKPRSGEALTVAVVAAGPGE